MCTFSLHTRHEWRVLSSWTGVYIMREISFLIVSFLLFQLVFSRSIYLLKKRNIRNLARTLSPMKGRGGDMLEVVVVGVSFVCNSAFCPPYSSDVEFLDSLSSKWEEFSWDVTYHICTDIFRALVGRFPATTPYWIPVCYMTFACSRPYNVMISLLRQDSICINVSVLSIKSALHLETHRNTSYTNCKRIGRASIGIKFHSMHAFAGSWL